MGFSIFTDLITPTSFKVPEAPTVDLSAEQLAGVEANYASFAGAKKLATDFNAFMQEAVSRQLKEAVPEFATLQKQMAANLSAQLKGEIPTDVSNQVQRRAGAKSLSLGIAGSPASTNLKARDLGITSLQLQGQAQAQTPGYLSTISSLTRAPLFDFSSVFMSPAQRVAFQFQNKENVYNRTLIKNQMDAAPEPWMKALAGLGDGIVNGVAAYYTMGGSMLGDMGGGGGKAGAPNLATSTVSPYMLGGYNFNQGLNGR